MEIPPPHVAWNFMCECKVQFEIMKGEVEVHFMKEEAS
jgi:hypothetical protein